METRRFAVTHNLVKAHQQMLVWKTRKEKNNYDNS